MRYRKDIIMEKNLDFDKVINRNNTNCIKYDSAAAHGVPEGLIPLWVADMDFATSSYIQEAVMKQAERGIWGYDEAGPEYFPAVQEWMKAQFDWEVSEEWMVKTPGIVFAIALLVKALTKQGDAVLIQEPVYHPFKKVISSNNRKAVVNSLTLMEDGHYEMDVADFEKQIVDEKVKLFILCSPHNPVGRVWKKEELIAIGDICYKHGVIVVSDEIHADIVFEGKHQVFANIKEEYREITITCTAPSKTFNIAGLHISNLFIENKELREKFQGTLSSCGCSELNAAGLVACEAAYKHGRQWYDAMMKYINENILFMEQYIKEEIPQIKMKRPEGTYLVWLDLRGLNMSATERRNLVVEKAKLWLNDGAIFGDNGEGFERVNVACPRATLQQAMNQLRDAIVKK